VVVTSSRSRTCFLPFTKRMARLALLVELYMGVKSAVK